MNEARIKDLFLKTMVEIADKIKENEETVDTDNILNLINAIIQVKNDKAMVFVYGAGRSGFIGRCFAQRLMHLGIKSCFISDAVTHQYSEDDLLIIISGSGETTSSVAIAKKANEIGGKIALLTGNLTSSIGKLAHFVIKIEGKSKDKAISQETLAPYTSLFDISALSVLDSIGGAIMKLLGVTESDIEKRHASIE
ncbi:MAG: SIS domain-containing protein [Promethearchaeota archaeon]|nr:MAG: SIS domain-containing protein [Candidatus Lokiarchaeota archaeon]